MSAPEKGITNVEIINFIFVVFCMFLLPLFPFILWERSVRKFRRENNLSIYKNIEKELEQFEFDSIAKKEHQAKKNIGVSSDINKEDIEYWYGLLKDGAITEEEYTNKKKELI